MRRHPHRTGELMVRGPRTGRQRRGQAALAGLMVLSIGLLALNRIGHDSVDGVRWKAIELLAPVVAAATWPADRLRQAVSTLTQAFDVQDEVVRLRDENQRLKGWEWRAQEAERRLKEVSSLARLASDTQMQFVTSRVVASARGPFVQSGLVYSGEDHGVKTGNPVLSGDGLVGRIAGTARSSALVMFLTDAASRIPVQVGSGGVRAIMSGDNSPLPRLGYFETEVELSSGDAVSTSGVGGLFPRGLKIGSVVKDGAGYRVQPDAAIGSLEFVSILFFDNPMLGLIDGAEAARGVALQEPSAGPDMRSRP